MPVVVLNSSPEIPGFQDDDETSSATRSSTRRGRPGAPVTRRRERGRAKRAARERHLYDAVLFLSWQYILNFKRGPAAARLTSGTPFRGLGSARGAARAPRRRPRAIRERDVLPLLLAAPARRESVLQAFSAPAFSSASSASAASASALPPPASAASAASVGAPTLSGPARAVCRAWDTDTRIVGGIFSVAAHRPPESYSSKAPSSSPRRLGVVSRLPRLGGNALFFFSLAGAGGRRDRRHSVSRASRGRPSRCSGARGTARAAGATPDPAPTDPAAVNLSWGRRLVVDVLLPAASSAASRVPQPPRPRWRRSRGRVQGERGLCLRRRRRLSRRMTRGWLRRDERRAPEAGPRIRRRSSAFF